MAALRPIGAQLAHHWKGDWAVGSRRSGHERLSISPHEREPAALPSVRGVRGLETGVGARIAAERLGKNGRRALHYDDSVWSISAYYPERAAAIFCRIRNDGFGMPLALSPNCSICSLPGSSAAAIRASLLTGSTFECRIVGLHSLPVASATALRRKFRPLMTAVTWPAESHRNSLPGQYSCRRSISSRRT